MDFPYNPVLEAFPGMATGHPVSAHPIWPRKIILELFESISSQLASLSQAFPP